MIWGGEILSNNLRKTVGADLNMSLRGRRVWTWSGGKYTPCLLHIDQLTLNNGVKRLGQDSMRPS